MKITVKVGILVAACWILIKMIFFYNSWNTREMLPFLVLLNILGILLAVSIGLYLQKRIDKKEAIDGNALRDIKSAMTAGVPYTIIIGVFLYFYYANIDPGYNERQIADAEVQILKSLESPEGLKEIRESNQKYEVMGKQEIYEEMSEGPKNLYNAKFTMTVSLLAMLVLTTVNSIVITIIYRKLIFRS